MSINFIPILRSILQIIIQHWIYLNFPPHIIMTINDYQLTVNDIREELQARFSRDDVS